MQIREILVGASMAVLAGCASVPMTSLQEDASGKAFTVPDGKANIYLYRNETLGAAIPVTVSLDGKLAGQTASMTYFLWTVEPGSHEITCNAENTETLRLNTSPGKNYFVWQEMKMGMWMARCALSEKSEEEGRKGVQECKRAQAKF
ncbi:MAG TPA: DUF2846 domain-containing protein [Burkholderiales bacterium]|nr:DUF2846 domain-containing protein [Burkholderiales bacterium]